MRAPVRRGKGSFAAADHSLYSVSRSGILRRLLDYHHDRQARPTTSAFAAHGAQHHADFSLARSRSATPRSAESPAMAAAARDSLGCCHDEYAAEKRLEELHGCDADSEAAQHSPDNGACNHRPGDPSIASRERKAEGRIIPFVRIPTHTRMHPPIRARKRQNLVGLEVCPDAVAIDREGIVGPAAQETRGHRRALDTAAAGVSVRGCTQQP